MVTKGDIFGTFVPPMTAGVAEIPPHSAVGTNLTSLPVLLRVCLVVRECAWGTERIGLSTIWGVGAGLCVKKAEKTRAPENTEIFCGQERDKWRQIDVATKGLPISPRRGWPKAARNGTYDTADRRTDAVICPDDMAFRADLRIWAPASALSAPVGTIAGLVNDVR